MVVKLEYKIDKKTGSKVYNLSDISKQSGNISKVDRYRWNKPSKKPYYEKVDKKKLKLSPLTQREHLNLTLINDIRQKFDWSHFSALDVSKHPDGSYWVTDGQHRLLAALQRSDVGEVPCMVTETSGDADDAKIFIAKNLHSTKVEVIDKHRVKLNAGEPSDVWMNALFNDLGISETQAKNLIYVGWLIYEKEDTRKLYEGALRLMANTHAEKSYSTAVLKGLMYILQNCNIPDYAKFEAAISKIAHFTLVNACTIAKEKYGRSNNQSGEHNAIEMCKIINKHLRGQSQISFNSSNERESVSNDTLKEALA